MIQIFDNFIPEETFNQVKTQVLSTDFLWNCVPTNYNEETLSFGKNYINKDQLDDISEIKNVADNLKQIFNFGDLKRIRVGLIHRDNEYKIHAKHVDYTKPHITVLWYLYGEDGDTYFYDGDGNTIARVTPKQNRLVVFDGLIEHSSSTPVKEQIRIAINFNFNLKEE